MIITYLRLSLTGYLRHRALMSHHQWVDINVTDSVITLLKLDYHSSTALINNTFNNDILLIIKR